MIIDLKTQAPACKRCKTPMVDATALMMGVKYRCPKGCSRILEQEWREIVSKSKTRKQRKT